jgi:hypothetical protein
MSDLMDGSIEIDDVSNDIAPKFSPMFATLVDVMSTQEEKMRIKEAKQTKILINSSNSQQMIKQRPPEIAISSIPSKRDSSEPTTPDQPTLPVNPNFTSSTSESKDEENTKMLLKQLLLNTMSFLERDFRKISWQRSGYKVEIIHTFFPFYHKFDIIDNEIGQSSH